MIQIAAKCKQISVKLTHLTTQVYQEMKLWIERSGRTITSKDELIKLQYEYMQKLQSLYKNWTKLTLFIKFVKS